MFRRTFFILALNYHGSTLLAKLLNGHPRVVCLVDTYPSNRFDQICGCGVPVSECGFWQTVKQRLRADRYLDQPVMLPAYPRIFGGSVDRYLYNTLRPTVTGRLVARPDARRFVEEYATFLECVHAQYKEREPEVFVDGCKSIARVAAFLASGARVDGVIHLTRDAGDSAKSTMKQVSGGMPTLVRSAIGWRLYHGRARRLRRYAPYLPISYEELTDRTDETLEKLFEFMDVEPMRAAALLQDQDVPWHFMGNVSLFGFDGRIARRRYELSRTERRLVRLLAGREMPKSR